MDNRPVFGNTVRDSRLRGNDGGYSRLPFAPPTVILISNKTAVSLTGLRRLLLTQEYSVIDRATGNLSPGLTRPARIKLESLADDRLRVKEPIEVVVFETEGLVVAEAEELYECGDGTSQAAAVADLQYALADLYFTLAAEQGNLGQGLRQVWEILQTKVERV